MNPIVRNILAVLAGLILGCLLNIGILDVGENIIPSPGIICESRDELLKSDLHLFEPKHFIMPFLAHALGTLAGAFIAAKLAVGNKMRAAFIIGICFLVGGIINVVSLPSPMWFTLLDVLVAYLPMAFLGGKLASRKN
ncbi:MAG: hypothetical protein ACO1N9_03450 [Flavobacterium sp.]